MKNGLSHSIEHIDKKNLVKPSRFRGEKNCRPTVLANSYWSDYHQFGQKPKALCWFSSLQRYRSSGAL